MFPRFSHFSTQGKTKSYKKAFQLIILCTILWVNETKPPTIIIHDWVVVDSIIFHLVHSNSIVLLFKWTIIITTKQRCLSSFLNGWNQDSNTTISKLISNNFNWLVPTIFTSGLCSQTWRAVYIYKFKRFCNASL